MSGKRESSIGSRDQQTTSPRRRRRHRHRRSNSRGRSRSASSHSHRSHSFPKSTIQSQQTTECSALDPADTQRATMFTMNQQPPLQSQLQPPRGVHQQPQQHPTRQQQQHQQPRQQQQKLDQEASDEYQLLLNPVFSAMTKITENLFLTGVGGMTRENFRKNHIDFVVNITTEAPFWENIESMRLPLEDDISANILPYLDIAVDRIQEAITKRNAHVLVHCVAGVSRSATIVIAYLMKFLRMDLRSAFNYCCSLRPVIRPNNGFMVQLINYEQQLFHRSSVRMVDADVDGTIITVPHFFIQEHPRLVLLEVYRVRNSNPLAVKTTATTRSTMSNPGSKEDAGGGK